MTRSATSSKCGRSDFHYPLMDSESRDYKSDDLIYAQSGENVKQKGVDGSHGMIQEVDFKGRMLHIRRKN